MNASSWMAGKAADLAALGFRRADPWPIPSECTPVAGDRHRISAARPSMGTLVSVTAIHPSRDLLEATLGQAFEEMDRVVGLLNRYDPASAVSILNSEGRIQGPPPELSSVMGEALIQNRISRGAFDPTVLPLVDRFRGRSMAGQPDSRAPTGIVPPSAPPPTPGEIRQLLDLVDPSAVALGPRAIRLEKEGMGVTLDGIAKGYVVDRMAEVLLGREVTDFLIDAGGDIRSAGSRDDGRAWRVAVQDPGKRGAFPDVVPLSGMAVATSGSYEVYFDPDRTRHHIVDSRRGRSPQESQSVSVMAPTTMVADALATSVFLMAPDRGAAFIDSIPYCACLIVDRNGRQVRSARWRSASETLPTKAETL
jgi:thiamine biosynthesis lipoprotein